MIRRIAIRLAHWILDHYQAWPPLKVRVIRQFVPVAETKMVSSPQAVMPVAAAIQQRSAVSGFSKL